MITARQVRDALLARWRNESVSLNAGATTAELAALERALGAPLPRDVRAFYTTTNGMAQPWDEQMMFVWPIADITTPRETRLGTDRRGEYRDVGFGDVFVGSWHLWFRIRGGRVTIVLDNPAVEFRSLTAFFRAYLRDPEHIAGHGRSAAPMHVRIFGAWIERFPTLYFANFVAACCAGNVSTLTSGRQKKRTRGA